MPTITDPGGSPSPAYNRSGSTVSSVTAAGNSSGTATQLTHYTERDIVLVTVPDGSNTGIMLPPDAEIGDRIEIYQVSGAYGVSVYPSSGKTINGSSAASSQASVTKVTSTDWRTTT